MRHFPAVLLGMLFLTFSTSLAFGQYGDISDVKIAKPADKQDVKPVPAPKGAIVLYDGKNLDHWYKADLAVEEGKAKGQPAEWKQVEGKAMQAGGGNIMTREMFGGPFKLHLEFRVPYVPHETGQGRGNSGVYIQGRYEVQVLDSYGLKPKDDDCGAIYEVKAPSENACKAPTIWQSYDIEFHPPTCENGKKTAPARITVIQNGIKIQDNTAIPVDNTRVGLGGDPCTAGPIMLQDHGHPVQYRNIWIVPMDKKTVTQR